MTQVGEWTTPTLRVAPYDGTTAVTLSVQPPVGVAVGLTATLLGTVTEDSVTYQVWSGPAYQLTAAGPWEERWTVTGVGKGPQVNVITVSGAYAAGRAGFAYATPQDYADLIGGTVPDDILLRLHQATCDIDNALMSSVYNPDDAAVAAALKRACVQQAYAVAGAGGTGGVVAPAAGTVAATSIGGASITYATGAAVGGAATEWLDGLCPKAWAELARIGLTAGTPGSNGWNWLP